MLRIIRTWGLRPNRARCGTLPFAYLFSCGGAYDRQGCATFEKAIFPPLPLPFLPYSFAGVFCMFGFDIKCSSAVSSEAFASCRKWWRVCYGAAKSFFMCGDYFTVVGRHGFSSIVSLKHKSRELPVSWVIFRVCQQRRHQGRFGAGSPPDPATPPTFFGGEVRGAAGGGCRTVGRVQLRAFCHRCFSVDFFFFFSV